MNIDQIKRKILEDVLISDVVSNYLDIQKKGDGYISVCPFHDDSKPSLNINDKKKIYKCFACNAGGNAIYFVRDFKKISELQAIKEIISKLNLDIKLDDTAISNNRPYQIKMINKEACEVFQAFLITKDAEKAYNYLINNRQLNKHIIKRFSIGYSVKGTNLNDFLISKDFKLADIEESNLISHKDGKNFDFFGGRIVFPIKDVNGDIIGFSGRAIEESNAKYLNTKENIVFKKSEILYNYSDAKKTILEKKQVIICEGFMDVIALYRIRVENAIAIMGVNLSDYHIQILSKLESPIFTIFLDGDDAGTNATMAIIKKLLSKNIKTNIIYNNTKLDPDDLLNNQKGDYLKSIVDKPLSVIDFLIKKFLKDVNQDNLSVSIEKVFEVISYDVNSVNTSIYINKLTDSLKKFNLDYDNIIQDLNRYKEQHRHVIVKNTQVSRVNDFIEPIDEQESTKIKNIEDELSKIYGKQRKSIVIETMILKTIAFSLINKSLISSNAYRETFMTMAKYASKASVLFYALEESYKEFVKEEKEGDFGVNEALQSWKNILLDDPQTKRKLIERIHKYYNLAIDNVVKADNKALESLANDISQEIFTAKAEDIRENETLIEEYSEKIKEINKTRKQGG